MIICLCFTGMNGTAVDAFEARALHKVTQLQYVAVVLISLLAFVGFRKGQRYWRVIEMGILICGYLLSISGQTTLRVSFPVFLLTKMVTSVLCVVFEMLSKSSKVSLPKLSFLMGTDDFFSRWWGEVLVVCPPKVLAATSYPDGADLSWKSTPQVRARPPLGSLGWVHTFAPKVSHTHQ